MDIDGLVDYRGKAFIYLEGKLKGKQVEYGQRSALDAVVASHWKSGHPSIAIIYEHDIPVTERVPVAYMFIRGICTLKPIPCLTGKRYYDKVKNIETNWYFPQTETIKVISAFDIFESHFRVF